MPITPCTTELFRRLTELGVTVEHPAYAGVWRALGVWPGDQATSEQYPVIGFHLTRTEGDPQAGVAQALVCYLVTPGRFARYEWTPAESLLFVTDVSRIKSVTENSRGPELLVTLELDAQASVTTGQTRTQVMEDGSVAGLLETRTQTASYVLVAQTPDEAALLSRFSLAAAVSIGA